MLRIDKVSKGQTLTDSLELVIWIKSLSFARIGSWEVLLYEQHKRNKSLNPEYMLWLCSLCLPFLVRITCIVHC